MLPLSGCTNQSAELSRTPVGGPVTSLGDVSRATADTRETKYFTAVVFFICLSVRNHASMAYFDMNEFDVLKAQLSVIIFLLGLILMTQVADDPAPPFGVIVIVTVYATVIGFPLALWVLFLKDRL